MDCAHCQKEREKELSSNQLSREIDLLLEKYRNKLDAITISSSLVLQAKIEMCCYFPCFHHMLGILTDMVNHDIDAMWKELKPIDKEDNAPCTL
jgi:hypothetical protein